MKFIFLFISMVYVGSAFATTECSIKKLNGNLKTPYLATVRMEFNKIYELKKYSSDIEINALALKLRVEAKTVSASPDDFYTEQVLTVFGYNPYRFKVDYSVEAISNTQVFVVDKKTNKTFYIQCAEPQGVPYFVRTTKGIRYSSELNYQDLKDAQCIGGRLGKAVTDFKAMDWGLSAVVDGETLKMKQDTAVYVAGDQVSWVEEAQACVTTKCEPEGDIPTMKNCDTVCTNLNQDRTYTLPRCQ